MSPGLIGIGGLFCTSHWSSIHLPLWLTHLEFQKEVSLFECGHPEKFPVDVNTKSSQMWITVAMKLEYTVQRVMVLASIHLLLVWVGLPMM